MEENDERKTLVESISIEKIAAIKSKRLANKRVATKPTGSNKIPKLDEEHKTASEALAHAAMARERQHRNRDELLMGDKDLTGILEALAKVFDFRKRRLIDKSSKASLKLASTTASKPQPCKLREVPVVPPRLEPTMGRAAKYNRYGQERFLKPVGISGRNKLGINPLGTNIVKHSSSSTRHRSSSSHQPKTKPPEGKCLSRKPIIVVPAALTSIITLHNAKQLLQDMRYVPVDQMRQKGTQHLEEVVIERRFRGSTLRYRVIDNVTRLRDDEWERVAAVFALGPHWQFKGWPYKGDPAVIFHHVCAFHLHFKDSVIHKDLKNMEVHTLSLPKYERHSDCGILMEFWNKLDQHIAHNHRQFAFMKQK